MHSSSLDNFLLFLTETSLTCACVRFSLSLSLLVYVFVCSIRITNWRDSSLVLLPGMAIDVDNSWDIPRFIRYTLFFIIALGKWVYVNVCVLTFSLFYFYFSSANMKFDCKKIPNSKKRGKMLDCMMHNLHIISEKVIFQNTSNI